MRRAHAGKQMRMEKDNIKSSLGNAWQRMQEQVDSSFGPAERFANVVLKILGFVLKEELFFLFAE